MSERASRVRGPRGEVPPALAVPPPARERAATACCACAAASCTACCTTGDEPAGRRARRADGARPRAVRRRGRRSARRAAWGIERMRFALGVDDDLRPFHDRFRVDPLIGARRARRPGAARAPPARAVRGARLGDLRAADRVRARGRDPAADRRAARAPLRAHRACATLPTPATARRAGAGAAVRRSTSRRARARAAARRARRSPRGRVDLHDGRATSAGWRAAARDPRHRHLDDRAARAARPGPLRPAAGRRPRLPEARRAAAQRRSARARRPRTRCATSSRPTAPGPASPPPTRCAPARRAARVAAAA